MLSSGRRRAGIDAERLPAARAGVPTGFLPVFLLGAGGLGWSWLGLALDRSCCLLDLWLDAGCKTHKALKIWQQGNCGLCIPLWRLGLQLSVVGKPQSKNTRKQAHAGWMPVQPEQ